MLKTVFPTSAGINRSRMVRSTFCAGVPRVSGDKPEWSNKTDWVQGCSPRQRG
ncbi:hypothetical protein QG25_002624 [Salmonella enterica subsp. salamae]|nr:hypothetical protein [Salmonella enterica subsp. salamae]